MSNYKASQIKQVPGRVLDSESFALIATRSVSSLTFRRMRRRRRLSNADIAALRAARSESCGGFPVLIGEIYSRFRGRHGTHMLAQLEQWLKEVRRLMDFRA
jgi:hypothetical protein